MSNTDENSPSYEDMARLMDEAMDRMYKLGLKHGKSQAYADGYRVGSEDGLVEGVRQGRAMGQDDWYGCNDSQ